MKIQRLTGGLFRGKVPGDEKILVRKLMSMTLSADHRVVNGAYAAQFLDYLRRLLEDTSTFK